MKKTRKRGGNVIASGGFGCIFDPPLACGYKKQTRKTGYVSKLMLKKYAQKEYKEIQKYKKIVETIPNHTDYFLLDGISLCKDLHPLTEEDLENFDKKCKTIKKKGIGHDEINNHLKELMSVQMPYGGIEVDDYIEKIQFHEKNMKQLNHSLVNLLVNGILPMNQLGLYHGDIKDSNVLVQDSTQNSINKMYTRLIDWGLSSEYSNSLKISQSQSTEKKALHLPEEFTRRPFQFNMPFSIILFQKSFLKLYKSFLKKNPYPDYFKIRSFVINYVLFVIDKKGPGHLKNINFIIKQLFKGEFVNVEEKFKDDLIEFEYTFYFIFEYLSKVLFEYTRENEFHVMNYFENVFLKNVDVWGFVTIYISFVEYLFDVKENRDLTKNEMRILQVVKEMYLMLMESSCKPIDTGKLLEKIKSLDDLFSPSLSKSFSKNTNKTQKSRSETKTVTESVDKSLVDTSSLEKSTKSKTKKNFFTNLFS